MPMMSFATASEDDRSRRLKFPVKRNKLQGPRPAALEIGKCSNSSKIIKKPAIRQKRSPVVIYLVSPKIIHARPEDFMGLVQRLTGNQQATSSSSPSSNVGCSEDIQAAVVSDAVNVGQGHDDHHVIRQAHDEFVSSSSPSSLAAYSSLCIDVYSNWDDF